MYLPIKGQYFNEIMSGTKDKEYREVKDTTYKKYLWTVDNGDFMLSTLDDDFVNELTQLYFIDNK